MKKEKGEYIPHGRLEDLNVKLTINQLHDEKNILRYFLDNGSQENQKLDVFITAQLVMNEMPIIPPRQSNCFSNQMLLDFNIVFDVKYSELPYNAIVAITIWDSNKSRDPNHPLGGTIISLFDEELKLRQGSYHLYIWPNTLPDITYNSLTPGIVQDKNIQDIQFASVKNDLQNQSGSNYVDNTNFSTLGLKLFYTYQKIPAAFLEVEFPKFNFPVFFEDIKQNFEGNDSRQDVQQQSKSGTINSSTEGNFLDCIIVSDFDYENDVKDPVREQYFLLDREDDENVKTLKPNQSQQLQINKLIKKPCIFENTPRENQLFYKFRYALKDNHEALVRFLYSINWQSSKEIDEAMSLLKQWAPCSYVDALHLLSSSFCANDVYNKKSKKPFKCVMEIRNYAVKVFEKVPDEQVISILLQLTQALRYEPYDISESMLVQYLVTKSCQNIQFATLFYWYLNVEKDQDKKEKTSDNNEDELVQKWFDTLFFYFQNQLQQRNLMVYQQICSQIDFKNKLQQINREIKVTKKDRKSELRKRLSADEFKSPTFKEHSFSLFPDLVIQEAQPEECFIFSSAMAPMKLSWKITDTKTNEQKKLDFIYKNGDDLRQDQLILQTFSVMDQLLKGINQDFKLSPYKVLACSKSDGFMEFLPNTKTLQKILQDNNKNLASYFKLLTADETNPLYNHYRTNNPDDTPQQISDKIQNEVREQGQDIHKTIIENYVLSCAGYCVLTYFLGIGDRHQENLLINKFGQLMHIDFGYILGRDPKPYPPPIKISPEMVDVMKKYNQYEKFQRKCVDAYIYLRKHAKLIVNLFHMMLDSGINDLSYASLYKLADKFYIEESDEQAEIHFLTIVQESINALFAKINDRFHKWAAYFREK